MKRGRFLLPLLCGLLLTACSRTEEWNYPPALSVACGGKTALVGAWSAGWDGGPEGTSFTACGDTPTSIYARPNLTRFEGNPGENLVLTYGETPSRLTVYYTPDEPEGSEQVTLFEGTPEGEELVLALPEGCGGIYEAHAGWETVGKGEGYTSCGWLIVDPEREAAVLKDGPPDLAVAYWGDCEVTAWKGGFNWTVPDGGETMQEVIACGPHPLDVADDLPTVEAGEGDTLILAFEAVPDKVEVEYFRTGDSAADAQPTPYEPARDSVIELYDDPAGTVWVVHAKWETGGNQGGAEYAFRIP